MAASDCRECVPADRTGDLFYGNLRRVSFPVCTEQNARHGHGRHTGHQLLYDRADDLLGVELHHPETAADRRLSVAGFPGIFSCAGQAGSGHQ